MICEQLFIVIIDIFLLFPGILWMCWLSNYALLTKIGCKFNIIKDWMTFWCIVVKYLNTYSIAWSTWMCDHQAIPGAVNLGLFISVDLNLWLIVYLVVMVLTRTLNESNQTKPIAWFWWKRVLMIFRWWLQVICIVVFRWWTLLLVIREALL